MDCGDTNSEDPSGNATKAVLPQVHNNRDGSEIRSTGHQAILQLHLHDDDSVHVDDSHRLCYLLEIEQMSAAPKPHAIDAAPDELQKVAPKGFRLVWLS